MQFITIGKPPDYLRLTAVRQPPDSAPEFVHRQRRRYLDAELRGRDVTAKLRLDLFDEYGGLVQFLDQVAAHWHDMDNWSMAWGRGNPLRLEVIRGPRPALGPDHLIVHIKLHHGGQRFWTLETSLILSPEEFEAIARDAHRLTD